MSNDKSIKDDQEYEFPDNDEFLGDSVSDNSDEVFVESDSNGWINFPIFYKHRDSLLRFLFLNNRDIAIYFYRNCNQLDIFKEYKNENLKNINEVVNEIIILPTYPKYEAEQIYTNIKLIKKYFQK